MNVYQLKIKQAQKQLQLHHIKVLTSLISYYENLARRYFDYLNEVKYFDYKLEYWDKKNSFYETVHLLFYQPYRSILSYLDSLKKELLWVHSDFFDLL